MRSLLFKLCLIAGTSMFIFGNCNKSDDNPTPSENFTALTVGSSWTYLGTPGGAYTLTVTSKDTVALTHTYKVLTNSAGPNNYQAKIGTDYFRFGAFAGIAPQGLEELYLKDGQSLNATWSTNQTFNVTGVGNVTATLTYTVKEKGIARTVNAKAFTDVTHIRLDITVPLIGSIGNGEFYYAQGIGLIESSLNINVPGQAPVAQAQVLTAYTIK